MSDSVKIRIDGDDSHYEKTLKNIEAKTEKSVNEISKKTQKAMQAQADIVGGVNKAAKGIAATAVAVSGAVLATGIAYNSQVEQYQAGFETMLGSAEKANDMLGQLREFSSVTPFELTDLANASTTLLAFGEDVNDLMPDLKMLGDISLGNKEKFSSLALVFGQVKSQGRLMGQDLLQMINSGFNPLQIISEKTGESMTSLKDKMSKGQISFEMVAEAMRMATSEGGKFYNAMDSQSKTLKGQFSTLTDNVKDFAGTVSEDLSGHLTNTVLPALIDKVETLKEMWEDGSLEKWLGGAAAAATTFGVAVAGMNIALLIKDLQNIKKGVESYTAVTKLGTAAQKAFNASQVATPWGAITIAILAVVSALGVYKAITNDATNSTKELAKEIENTRTEYDESIEAIDKSMNEQIAETKIVDSLKDKLYELEEQLNSNTLSEELAKEKRKEFNTVANELNEIIPGIIDKIGTETNQFVLQRNAIEDLVASYKELSITKAYSDAYYNKMTEAAEKAIEAEKNFLNAEKNFEKTKKGLNDDANKNWDLLVSQHGGVPVNPHTGEKIDRSIWKQKWIGGHIDTQEALKTYETAQKEMRDLQADVDGYNELYLKNLEKVGELTKDMATKTGDDVSGTVTGVTNIVETETDKQETIINQALKDELRALETAHKLGVISDKEYYAAMAKIRDTYFEEGSEEWQSYTDEIEAYYDDVLTELAEKMQSFSQKLQDDTNKTYATITLTADGETKSWTTLADMDSQNAQLEEYLALLNEVKTKRGGIPEAALADLESMGTEEAVTFLRTMAKASDAEWNNWVEGIEKNKQLAEEISANFYDEELKGNQELIDKLMAQWGELPEDFFAVGEDCAAQYGEGLKSVLGGILSELRAEIASTLSVIPSSSIISTSAGTTGGGNVYNDNRTTTYNLPSDSTRTRIEADKQNQIYQEHTSAFGG